MSRTDAHTPLWVRIARGDLDVEADHANVHAVCDLPESPPVSRGMWKGNTKCRWVFSFTGTYICSCPMCHAGPQNRQSNRNRRHESRIAVAEALGRWRAGDGTAFDDVVMPSESHYW